MEKRKMKKEKKLNPAVIALIKEYEKENPTEREKKFLDWCIKGISGATLFENGFVYEFEKKSIKKDFCFGTGQNGLVTEGGWNSANNAAIAASTNSNYFLEYNFKENFEFLQKILADYIAHDYKIYAASTHSFKPSNRCYLVGEKALKYRDEQDFKKYYQLTENDIENLKKTLFEEKEKLSKRLSTYLKKYGLTKINSWSYISD